IPVAAWEESPPLVCRRRALPSRCLACLRLDLGCLISSRLKAYCSCRCSTRPLRLKATLRKSPLLIRAAVQQPSIWQGAELHPPSRTNLSLDPLPPRLRPAGPSHFRVRTSEVPAASSCRSAIPAVPLAPSTP